MPIYPEGTYEWAVQRLGELMEEANNYLARYKKAGLEVPPDTHYPNFKPEFFYDYHPQREFTYDRSKEAGFSNAYDDFELYFRDEFDWISEGLEDGEYPMAEEFEWTREELELAGQLTIYGVAA